MNANMEIKNQLLFWHLAGTFFESFDKWLSYFNRPGLPAEISGGTDPDFDKCRICYDDLFRGTAADIYVPVWASACCGKGGVLLNEITLEVIRFYYLHGYRPKAIDGNPPDYIGNLFYFLEYLLAADHAEAADSGLLNKHDPSAAFRDFCDLYVIPVFFSMADAIKDVPEVPSLIENWINLIGASLSEEIFPSFGENLKPESDADEAVQYAMLHGLYPEIQPEEPRLVRSSGANNCGGRCMINLTVCEGCVIRTETDQGNSDPALRACVRGQGYRYTFFNSRRLRYPMIRRGERGEGLFRRISWEEAEEILAKEWIRIRDAYGVSSRFVMYGSGSMAVMRPDKMAKRLLNADGGFLQGYNTYSSACTDYITPYIYGDVKSGNSLEDVLNTRLLILWGHNPVETIFGSERNYYLAEAKKKGIRIIVIDPRMSETALTYADEWIGINPSSDAALACAMAWVILTEHLEDRHFMDTYCLGFDKAHMPEGIPKEECFESWLFGETDGIQKNPEWASPITGIDAGTIYALAREYANTKPACILPGFGPQRTGCGEVIVRAIAVLPALTGNIGIPGGGAAGSGRVQRHTEVEFPMLENSYKGSIPHFLWCRAVEKGTEMDMRHDGLRGTESLSTNIRMLLSLASNTLVNQHSDINKTISVLMDTKLCELIVCSDLFYTPSSRFADLLLPAPSIFETDNITMPWGFGDYLLFANQAVEPLFESRFEWKWLRSLSKKLEIYDRFTEGKRTEAEWLKYLYEKIRCSEPELPEFEEFKENGGHVYREKIHYIAFENEIRDPGKHPFKTPSGKIEIFSKRLYDMGDPQNIPGIPKYVSCPEGPDDPLRKQFPLQLIGWHTKRRTHSIHDQNVLMEEVEPQCMWMHPADAAERNILEGNTVRVYNSRGSVIIKAHLTERILKGVCAIPQGAWFRRDSSGNDIRGSINTLTSADHPTPAAKGNPQHTNLVEVELADQK